MQNVCHNYIFMFFFNYIILVKKFVKKLLIVEVVMCKYKHELYINKPNINVTVTELIIIQNCTQVLPQNYTFKTSLHQIPILI